MLKCYECNAPISKEQAEYSCEVTNNRVCLCSICLEHFKTSLYCMICGQPITYEEFCRNKGFYCDPCNDLFI